MGGFLNLFGGNDTQTSSSTTENITSITPTVIAGGGSSAVSAVANGPGDINITSSDPTVAMHAMDTTLTAAQDALLFGADAQRQAYGFGTKVLDFAQTSNRDALSFADSSNRATMAFADAQVKAANTTTQSAIGEAATAYQKALAFGSQQTGVALDALAGSAQMIDTAYKDAKGVLSSQVIMLAIAAGVAVMYFALKK